MSETTTTTRWNCETLKRKRTRENVANHPESDSIVCGYLRSRWQNIKLWIYWTKRSKKRANSSSGQSRWHEVEEIKKHKFHLLLLLVRLLSLSLSLSLSLLHLPFHCCCCYWVEFGSYEVILMRLNRSSKGRKKCRKEISAFFRDGLEKEIKKIRSLWNLNSLLRTELSQMFLLVQSQKSLESSISKKLRKKKSKLKRRRTSFEKYQRRWRRKIIDDEVMERKKEWERKRREEKK